MAAHGTRPADAGRVRAPRLRAPCRIAIAAAYLLVLPGCFTTFKTAKTIEGASLTLGSQRYVLEETEFVDGEYKNVETGHYFLVALARVGSTAERNKFGYELGMRIVTDAIDHPESRDAGYILTLEPRLQLPKNRYLDIALGVDFASLVLPGGASLYLSRDVTRWFTPYTEIKSQLALWSLLHGERIRDFTPRLTIGTAFTTRRFGRYYFEGEGYPDDSVEDQVRFSIGVELPPLAGASSE